MKLKLKMSLKILGSDKEMFDFSNYLTKSKYYDNSSKLVVGKMKDETAGVAINECFGLKPNIYSYLVDDNSEHKNAKRLNEKCCCNKCEMFKTFDE